MISGTILNVFGTAGREVSCLAEIPARLASMHLGHRNGTLYAELHTPNFEVQSYYISTTRLVIKSIHVHIAEESLSTLFNCEIMCDSVIDLKQRE